MTVINRQQYMNELSRLLTFMFKEDRSEIIKQYNDMLDNAEDEEAMLKSFGSPTKLAVTISRSYQRDEMKLSTKADSKDGTSTETIKVKPVIPEAKPAAATKAMPAMPAENPDDAYIDVIEEIRRELAAEEGVEYKPIFFKEESKPEAEEEAAPEEEAPEEETVEEAESPAEEAETEETEEPSEEEASAEEETEAEETEAPAEEEEEEEAAPVEEESAEAEEAEAEEKSEEPAETEEEAEQSEEAEESEEPSEEEAPAEEAEAEEAEAEETAEEAEAAPEEEAEEEKPEVKELELPDANAIFDELDAMKAPEAVTEKKTKVFALILYLLVSIPVGIAAAVVMLIAELAILGVSFAVLKAGFELLHFTFSGMTVFADVIVCLGVTLGVLAIGLLLLWLAVWLLIVSIPALVRGLIALGKKLCVKEVEVNG